MVSPPATGSARVLGVAISCTWRRHGHLLDVVGVGAGYADNQVTSQISSAPESFVGHYVIESAPTLAVGRGRSGLPGDGHGLRMSLLVARPDQLANQSPAD